MLLPWHPNPLLSVIQSELIKSPVQRVILRGRLCGSNSERAVAVLGKWGMVLPSQPTHGGRPRWASHLHGRSLFSWHFRLLKRLSASLSHFSRSRMLKLALSFISRKSWPVLLRKSFPQIEMAIYGDWLTRNKFLYQVHERMGEAAGRRENQKVYVCNLLRYKWLSSFLF